MYLLCALCGGVWFYLRAHTPPKKTVNSRHALELPFRASGVRAVPFGHSPLLPRRWGSRDEVCVVCTCMRGHFIPPNKRLHHCSTSRPEGERRPGRAVYAVGVDKHMPAAQTLRFLENLGLIH